MKQKLCCKKIDSILSKTASRTSQICRVGLEFVHREVIGWLWFSIAVMSSE